MNGEFLSPDLPSMRELLPQMLGALLTDSLQLDPLLGLALLEKCPLHEQTLLRAAHIQCPVEVGKKAQPFWPHPGATLINPSGVRALVGLAKAVIRIILHCSSTSLSGHSCFSGQNPQGVKREVPEAGQASFCQAGKTFVPSQRILLPLWHRPSESFGDNSCFGTNRVEQKEP